MTKDQILSTLNRLLHHEQNELKQLEQRFDYMKHPINVWNKYTLEQLERVELRINSKRLQIMESKEKIQKLLKESKSDKKTSIIVFDEYLETEEN